MTLRRIKELLYNLKQRIQRFKRGYADVDVWNIDSWYKCTMIKILKQLREEHLSYPQGMTNSQWEATLDRMIYCFEQATKEVENPYHEELEKALNWHDNSLTIDLPDDLRKKYNEAEKKIHEEKSLYQKEALDLFVRYFDDLWD